MFTKPALALLCTAVTFSPALLSRAQASPQIDTIKVSKCYSTFGVPCELLVKASSSNTSAHLYVYLPDGTYLGEAQNGGGSRYGGTVMPYQPYDPVNVTIRSSSGRMS